MEVVLVPKLRHSQPHKLDLGVGEAHLGRAWSSHLHLADTAVDALHARLFLDPTGQVQLQDLGSRNGTYLDGHRLDDEPVPLESGAQIQLGKTKFRFYLAEHPVPAARAPSRWDDLRLWLGSPSRVLLITLGSLALVLGFNYLEQTSKYTQIDFIQTLLTTLSIAVVWTLVWGGISRLLRGEAHLLANWSVGMLSLAAALVAEHAARWVGFNLQSLSAHTTIDSLLGAGIMLVSIFGAVSIATNLSRAGRWFAAVVPTVLALGGTSAVALLDDDKAVDSPPTLTLSMPPALAIGAREPADDFVSDTDRLFRITAAEATRMVAEEDQKRDAEQ